MPTSISSHHDQQPLQVPSPTYASLSPLLVALVAIVAYLTAIDLGWIWDDDQYVYLNPLLREFSGLWSIWFEPAKSPQYYPAVFSLLWIEYQLFGDWPLGYHLVNVLLHACNAALCVVILKRLQLGAAIWIGLAFALHPIQVETVAWVSELKNLLSAFFYGITWLIWWPLLQQWYSPSTADKLRPEEPHSRATAIALRFMLGCFTFSMALFSKTVTASLPAGMLLACWFHAGRISAKQLGIMLPLLAVGGAVGWNTARLERLHVGAVGADWEYGWLERMGIAARCLVHYASQALLPVRQIFFYPRFDPSMDLGSWLAIAICILAVAMVVAVAWRGMRGPFAALAFFVGSAFPALGFLNVYPHRFSFVADHFVYLPIVGILCLLWTGLWLLARRTAHVTKSSRLLSYLPLVLVLAGYVYALHRHLPNFQNAITLWEDTLSKNPNSVAAMQNLALAYTQNNRLEEALIWLERADHYDFDRYQTLNSLGMVRGMMGDREGARSAFEASIALKPDNPRPWVNLGNLTRATRDSEPSTHEQARNYYKRAWEVGPDYLAAFALGTLCYENGELEQAAEWFANAEAERPNDLDASFNLAQCLSDLDQPGEAAALAEKILKRYPRDVPTKRLLRELERQRGVQGP